MMSTSSGFDARTARSNQPDRTFRWTGVAVHVGFKWFVVGRHPVNFIVRGIYQKMGCVVSARNEVADPLTFDGEFYWSGQLRVPWWNEPLLVRVDAENGISVSQRQTLNALSSYTGSIRESLQTSLYEFCNSLRDEWGWPESQVPRLNDASEIWNLIVSLRIFVPDGETKKICFAIEGECTWDEEHGFCALIEDWRIARVGFPGELL